MGEKVRNLVSEMPKYSVLMSVYYKDRPEWLVVALNSILAQTVSPDEIVLIKDGPLSDELDLVVENFVKANSEILKVFCNKENLGLGLTLRDGILKCRNELIARMDADDVSDPLRIETQMKKIIEDPSLDIVGCWENEFYESTEKSFSIHKVPEEHDKVYEFMHYRCGILHPTVIFKKSAVLKAGNYRSLYLCEDYDLFVRMLMTGAKCYNVPKALYHLRVNPNFFYRRGGFKYAKTIFVFKYGLWRKGFFSFKNFFISGFGHALVCLFPNHTRKLFYKYWLR